jgi:Delta7-sterol 5-desaturase
MDIISSTKIILGTFSASTITILAICKYYNTPFLNPNHNRYQFYYNVSKVVPSTMFLLSEATVINSFLVNTFITGAHHSLFQNIENIVKYSLIAEFVYYVYHRIIHTKDYYKAVHSLHHENISVYPFDTFYMSKTDSIFLVISLSVPFLFLNMNFFETVISYYIYITAAYLEHSNLFLLHHAKHHKILFYNFCILNPIFDILAGTYKH